MLSNAHALERTSHNHVHVHVLYMYDVTSSQLLHHCRQNECHSKELFQHQPSPFMETTAYLMSTLINLVFSFFPTVANANTKAKRIDNSRLEA